MPDPILHEWVDVNSYMRDDYRLLVAAMAARQIKTVDAELQTHARNAFGSITVPGARSFFRADLIQQRKALAKAMQTQPQVAPIVIALWAHAAELQINLLKQTGETAGLEFSAEWNWYTALQGFYDFEDIRVLSALADGLGEHATDQEADHLKLAALYLGPAITNLQAVSESLAAEATDKARQADMESG